jgi:(4S)-4-hydroxy-5-phosphonooxypentane-2,3-dione isomerase
VHVVVATWVARRGQEADVERILTQMSERSAREPGCIEFTVYRSLSDERHYMLFERYEDEAAFQAHRHTEHFKTHVLGDAVANDRLEQRFAKIFEEL